MEEGRSSSNALATGSEVTENSRTDMTVFSLESSVEQRLSKRFFTGENPDSSLVASGARVASAEDDTQDDDGSNPVSVPFLGIKTSNDEDLKLVSIAFSLQLCDQESIKRCYVDSNGMTVSILAL